MSDPIDCKLAENLRRWVASGQPRLWAESHPGGWDEAELLAALRWSEYWPLDTAAVRQALSEWQTRPNFDRWRAAGEPERWVAARDGEWSHADWLTFLDDLRRSEYWPLDPVAVGAVVDGLGRERRNLRRWRASGQPARWVEARRGRWDHGDWLALVDALRASEFWPVNLDAVGQLLEELRGCDRNLGRWQASDQPRRWVEARQGQWGHADWLALLDELRRSEFWPLDPDAVGRVVAGFKVEWWNLQRWRASGLAARWVEARNGEWDHAAWLGLLDELRGGGFWPVDPAAVGRVLEEVRAEVRNCARWQAAGGPRRWVDAHPGPWGNDEVRALLDALRATEFWPLDARAVGGLLDGLARERTNLRRWCESGWPARWVAARGGHWDHAAWLALLDELRQSEFWPMAPDAIGQALEEAKGRRAERPTWLVFPGGHAERRAA
jgi:hypothetical protein